MARFYTWGHCIGQRRITGSSFLIWLIIVGRCLTKARFNRDGRIELNDYALLGLARRIGALGLFRVRLGLPTNSPAGRKIPRRNGPRVCEATRQSLCHTCLRRASHHPKRHRRAMRLAKHVPCLAQNFRCANPETPIAHVPLLSMFRFLGLRTRGVIQLWPLTIPDIAAAAACNGPCESLPPST